MAIAPCDDDAHAARSRSARKSPDAISSEDLQRLKSRLRDRAPKTVNNVLAVLGVLLKKAVEWDVIDRMPCAIRLLPIPKPSAGFYDFDDYERLVEAAKAEPNAYLIVLLGGEQRDSTAGLFSSRPASWQHCGNGIYRDYQLVSVEPFSWRGRRDSNPRPPA